MRNISSLTDFNRRQGEMISELESSGEPLYLTRNGKAILVVMSPDTFDSLVSNRDEVREMEMQIHDGLVRGYQEMLEGKTVPAADALGDLRSERGW